MIYHATHTLPLAILKRALELISIPIVLAEVSLYAVILEVACEYGAVTRVMCAEADALARDVGALELTPVGV
jgi:hypothetical protein